MSVVSAVEYARNAAAYHLLPDLAITCDGPVHSVVLFSRRPVEELDGARCCYGVLPDLGAAARAAVPPSLVGRAAVRHGAGRAPSTSTRCAACPRGGAGDRRRGAAARRRGRYPGRDRPGAAWKEWTGLPFVFAVWAARRTPTGRWSRRCTSGCSSPGAGAWPTSTSWRPTPRGHRCPGPVCREYLAGPGLRALSYRHLAGLTDFFRRLAQDGLVPDGSLSFIPRRGSVKGQPAEPGRCAIS